MERRKQPEFNEKAGAEKSEAGLNHSIRCGKLFDFDVVARVDFDGAIGKQHS
jgi:hypothetical protein